MKQCKSCKTYSKRLVLGYCMKDYMRYRKYGNTHTSQKVQESHGMYGTPEHRCWQHIKSRCSNPKDKSYKNYGQRGIKICDEWKNSFVAFYGYVGQRPSDAHTLDRVDNDGNYEPGNVRWATRKTQALNRRRPSKNKYGFRGVIKRERYLKYTANIAGYNIGAFDTIEEAAWMYDQFALEIHKEYAILNFNYK